MVKIALYNIKIKLLFPRLKAHHTINIQNTNFIKQTQKV